MIFIVQFNHNSGCKVFPSQINFVSFSSVMWNIKSHFNLILSLLKFSFYSASPIISHFIILLMHKINTRWNLRVYLLNGGNICLRSSSKNRFVLRKYKQTAAIFVKCPEFQSQNLLRVWSLNALTLNCMFNNFWACKR